MIKKLSPEEITSLEAQTETAFNAFTRAVKTKSPVDAKWAFGLYGCLLESLTIATDYAPFMNWRRGTQKSACFDQYILPYAVGCVPSSLLLQQAERIGNISARETDTTADDVIEIIDSGRQVTYDNLNVYVSRLAETDNFAAVQTVLEYIRRKFQKNILETMPKQHLPRENSMMGTLLFGNPTCPQDHLTEEELGVFASATEACLYFRAHEDVVRYGLPVKGRIINVAMRFSEQVRGIRKVLEKKGIPYKTGQLVKEEFGRFQRLVAEEVELLAFLPDKQTLYESLFGQANDSGSGN